MELLQAITHLNGDELHIEHQTYMSFPKGPRFAPEKVSDVPGPNFYKIEDANSEAYKRGAFLEKAERFKEVTPDIPGPGAYEIEVKATMQPRAGSSLAKQPSETLGYPTLKQQHDALRIQHARLQKEHDFLKGAFDRSEAALKANQEKGVQFMTLQRKLEELEKIHGDGKKAHLSEIERFKAELERSRKLSKDHADRIALMKKSNEAAEAKYQEMKKAALADQSEAKTLRHKLRMLEHERGQQAAKYGDAAEAQRGLHFAVAKRKEEVQDRDRKIMELQRALAAEKLKATQAAASAEESKAAADLNAHKVTATERRLEENATEAEAKARQAYVATEAMRKELESTNEQRLTQLERLKATLHHVVKDYGRLAVSSVASRTHTQVQLECAALRIRTTRLERKLANANDQVNELAHLIRQGQDMNALLSARLRDAEACQRWQSECLALDEGKLGPVFSDDGLCNDLDSFLADSRSSNAELDKLFLDLSQGTDTLLQLHTTELIRCFKAAEQTMLESETSMEALVVQLTASQEAYKGVAADLEQLRTDKVTVEKEWTAQTCLVAEVQAQLNTLQVDFTAMETRAKADLGKVEELLKKERQVNSRLVTAARQAKMAEDGMKAEIEQLVSELADVEKYREAHQQLMGEVGALLDRNALAEEEAERLSKFNAEILGHRNPTQRVCYVDKIRRELADIKQKLLTTAREHDAVLNENYALRDELKMYKSVAVPFDGKPRTIITRVARVPLVHSLANNVAENHDGEGFDDLAAHLPQIAEGEMTLDEIM